MYHNLDLKVQLMAALAIAVATSQKVETILRFTLLILSIVYTIYRLIDRFQEKRKEKLKNQDLTSIDDEKDQRS